MRVRATVALRALLLAGLPGLGHAWAGDAVAPAGNVVPANVETIILVRHGEKPPEGLGQLDCQGLNRALKLPAVLSKKYGRPDFIFAPDPGTLVDEGDGKFFYYVRPLVTIEPTAIGMGMPVNTEFGYTEIDKLRAELLDAKYKGRTIFVAWEHKKLNEMVKDMVTQLHGTVTVPKWPGTEFDWIYELHVRYDGPIPTDIALSLGTEGLNGQPDTCPRP